MSVRTDIDSLLSGGAEVVLVDFHADWCGPCKTMEPIIDEISQSPGVAILKVDIEKAPEAAKAFSVRSIPTIVAVTADGDKGTLVGVSSKQRIEELIASATV